tara:strand:- start:356 stop:601 length:246 start_codon:yes stop_codon:yes gene_type:complete
MGLRAIVMNETVINILADRLEKQAGDIALLNEKLTKLQSTSDKYYKWWTDEQDLTTKLEAQVKDLEAQLAGMKASYESAIE